MSLNEKKMIRLLREEYDTRINHYLREIEVKDNNDNDLIANAKGLKVKDKAGFMYTIAGVVEKEGSIYVRLLSSGEPLEDLTMSQSKSPIYESDEEEKFVKKEKARKKSSEQLKDKSKKAKPEDNTIIKRNPDAKTKRSFETDASGSPAFNDYDLMKSDDKVFFDVEIRKFEREFTLWKI